jgi:hypothetical protein
VSRCVKSTDQFFELELCNKYGGPKFELLSACGSQNAPSPILVPDSTLKFAKILRLCSTVCLLQPIVT